MPDKEIKVFFNSKSRKELQSGEKIKAGNHYVILRMAKSSDERMVVSIGQSI